jgi:hypothetical protein
MTSKKELHAEIERLASLVSAHVEADESKFNAFAKSVSEAAGTEGTLILADGTIVRVVIPDVTWQRASEYSLFDATMTVHPQPPKG